MSDERNEIENVYVNFATDNAAFDDEPASEIARILRDVAGKIEAGQFENVIRDLNGNKIGNWLIKGDYC